MNSYQFFSHAGGLLTVLAFVLYIHSVLVGNAKPAIASWAIWGGLNVLVAAGMIVANALNPQALIAAAASLIVFALSLPYGKPGWSMIDVYCLIGGLLGIALWLISGTPTLAIVTSLIAIFIANFPTYASVWEDPSRESAAAWSVAVASSAFTLLGVERWSIESLAQPVVFLLGQSIVLVLIFLPRVARA